ncbi:hypothetical protein ACK8OR_08075 [Jannaschia sp. KMU-145]|uniref:hypothetical protein n=1 Tax=Jannaschia halovivens TaxID=3388667 RepID=UPI00396B38E4
MIRGLRGAGRALALGVAALCTAAMGDVTAIPHIDLERDGEVVVVTSYVSGPPGETVRGEVTLQRRSGSNNVRTSQTTEVVIGADGRGQFSQTSVNVGGGTALAASLVISRDGAVAARTDLTLNIGP